MANNTYKTYLKKKKKKKTFIKEQKKSFKHWVQESVYSNIMLLV